MAIPKQTDPQYKLRMPQALKDHLDAAVAKSGRSLNAEIVYRLQWSIDEDQANERAQSHFRMLENVAAGTINGDDVPDVGPTGGPYLSEHSVPSDIDRLVETLAGLAKQQQRLDERLANGLSKLSAERQGDALDVRATLTALTKLERRLSSMAENAGGNQNARPPKDEPKVAAATKGRVRKTP